MAACARYAAAFVMSLAKLKRIKQWNREFDSRVEPLVKQLEKVNTVLANDMTKAAAYLAQAASTLHAYAEMAAPSIATATAPPSTPHPTDATSTGEKS